MPPTSTKLWTIFEPARHVTPSPRPFRASNFPSLSPLQALASRFNSLWLLFWALFSLSFARRATVAPPEHCHNVTVSEPLQLGVLDACCASLPLKVQCLPHEPPLNVSPSLPPRLLSSYSIHSFVSLLSRCRNHTLFDIDLQYGRSFCASFNFRVFNTSHSFIMGADVPQP
jgi:hypothetical protein